MAYFTNVRINTHYGYYEKCNVEWGLHLTSQRTDKRNLIVTIDIHLSDDLMKDTNEINVIIPDYYDRKQSGYKINDRIVFRVDKSYTGSTVMINYNSQGKILYQDTLTIPKLEIKGDTNCAICSEVGTDNIFVSPCHHLFHMDCIWRYLEKSELLNPLSKDCLAKCEHSNKPKRFCCPTCRAIIQ